VVGSTPCDWRFLSYTVSQTDFSQRPVTAVDGKPMRATDGGLSIATVRPDRRSTFCTFGPTPC